MSDNLTSAENQQGIPNEWWIAGFVDGEGCFSVSFVRSKTARFGYQIFTEFVVTQGEKSLSALQGIQKYFGVGKIYRNSRYDNHREDLFRYCVRSVSDLRKKICPFFDKFPLQTAKSTDFAKFCEVLEIIEKRQHLTPDGFEKIRTIASTMNRRKARNLEPSETNSQTPDCQGEDIVRSLWRHRGGEKRPHHSKNRRQIGKTIDKERNSLSGKF